MPKELSKDQQRDTLASAERGIAVPQIVEAVRGLEQRRRVPARALFLEPGRSIHASRRR